ncbi:MAG: hypothetical protein LBR33_06635 [Propionibacteriaceae bacterium]|jgi:hypothetical protein|nr:hypothetical protein [Propionibacteriaceae bacterium]
MAEPLRVPISVAARRGISAVADLAEEQRVVLTRLGRPVVVVDAAERIDADARLIREAAWSLVEAAGQAAADRLRFLDLDEACGRLGLDADEVRRRGAALAAA